MHLLILLIHNLCNITRKNSLTNSHCHSVRASTRYETASAVAVMIINCGNIIVAVKCEIQLVEVIVFTEATVLKITEATVGNAGSPTCTA